MSDLTEAQRRERLREATPMRFRDASWVLSDAHCDVALAALRYAAGHPEGWLPPSGNMACKSLYIAFTLVGWALPERGRNGPFEPLHITPAGRAALGGDRNG